MTDKNIDDTTYSGSLKDPKRLEGTGKERIKADELSRESQTRPRLKLKGYKVIDPLLSSSDRINRSLSDLLDDEDIEDIDPSLSSSDTGNPRFSPFDDDEIHVLPDDDEIHVLPDDDEIHVLPDYRNPHFRRYIDSYFPPLWKRDLDFSTRKKVEERIDRFLQKGSIPSKEYISKAISRFGRKHMMVTKLCNAVSKHILGLSEKVKAVTASYTKSKEDKVVFVIRHEDVVDPALHDAVARYVVYFRKVNCVSNEAEMVTYRQNYENEKFPKEENQNLNKTISRYSPSLFREHSNLNVISSSLVKSSGFMGDKEKLSEQACIVLYVSVKGFIPLQDEAFPTKIGDFETDVMEGCFSAFHKPANEHHEDLKAGCEIHCHASGLTGTIGPFVDVENKKCFLTCCHIICNDKEKGNLIDGHGGKSNVDSSCDIPIYQPNYSVHSQEIGKVTQLVFKEGDTAGNPGMDVAVVEITDRYPIRGTFPECSASMCSEIGYRSQSELSYSGEACSGPEDIEPGSSVVMFGSQSGLTRGFLRTNVTAVRTTDFVMNGSPYTLYNQLEVLGIQNSAGIPFAKPGDSGALVFLKKGCGPLVALGLLVGGTCSGQYIATPIWDIYKVLKCKPMTFNEEPTLPRQPNIRDKPASLEFDNFRNEIKHTVDDLRENIDTRFNVMETRLNAIDTRFNDIDTKINGMVTLLQEALKGSNL